MKEQENNLSDVWGKLFPDARVREKVKKIVDDISEADGISKIVVRDEGKYRIAFIVCDDYESHIRIRSKVARMGIGKRKEGEFWAIGISNVAWFEEIVKRDPVKDKEETVVWEKDK